MLTGQKGFYGPGLVVGGSGRSRYFSHGGVNYGDECQLIGYPATGQGAVIMTNATGGRHVAAKLMDVDRYRPRPRQTIGMCQLLRQCQGILEV